MLIRSQNKHVLINLQRAKSIGYRDQFNGPINSNHKFPISFVIVADGITIGDYSNREKCIKVLDMIQNAYETSIYSDEIFDYSAQVKRPYIFMDNKVFQMPQDSEVDV